MKSIQSPVYSYTVVVMSTAHLTTEDCAAIERSIADGEQMALKRDYGYFIKLHTDPAFKEAFESNNRHGASQTIKDIIQWAVREGFTMIEFDRDADIIPEFPTFEW